MVLLWDECEEDLRKVRPGHEERERDHEQEENLLVPTELANVWQQVVKVHQRVLTCSGHGRAASNHSLVSIVVVAVARTSCAFNELLIVVLF